MAKSKKLKILLMILELCTSLVSSWQEKNLAELADGPTLYVR